MAYFARAASLTIDRHEARTGAWHSLADGEPFVRVYAVPLDQEGVHALATNFAASPHTVSMGCLDEARHTTTFFGYADRRLARGEHPLDAIRRN